MWIEDRKTMGRQSHEAKQLPMCIEPRRPRAPGGSRWTNVAVLLVALAVAIFAWRTGSTGAPADIGAELRALDAAVGHMSRSLERLPRDAFNRVGYDVATLARSIELTSGKLGQLPPPMADPDVAYQMRSLHELVQAITAELAAVSRRVVSSTDRIAGIHRLAAAATERTVRLDAAAEAWAARTRGSIVTMEVRPDAILVSSVDRSIQDVARAAGIMLFLTGLLVVGLRLLSGDDGALGARHAFRQAPLPSSLGAVAIALFMVGSFTLGVAPEAVAGLFARTEVQPRQDTCLRLAARRQELHADLRDPQLIAAVARPLGDAATGCRSPEGAMVAAEAMGAEGMGAEGMGHDASRAAAPDEAAGATRADGSRGSDADLARGLNRLVQASEAHAAELPDAAMAAQAGSRGTPVVGGRAAVDVAAADEEIGEGQGAAAPARSAATAYAAPLPPGPAPRMPMPPDPAPRRFLTTDALNYRAGPSRTAPLLGTLARGTPVHMVSHAEDWSIVRLEDGRSVYVASEYLERPD